MDPFDEIYKIVFQLTMRAVGCDDIAEDPALLKKTLSLYETIDSSTTPATVIFPWFPTPALIKRTVAGARLYMMLQKIAERRRKNNVRGEDALQFLLDQGDTMDKIIAVSNHQSLYHAHAGGSRSSSRLTMLPVCYWSPVCRTTQ
jgi:sterol 14-demethylase